MASRPMTETDAAAAPVPALLVGGSSNKDSDDSSAPAAARNVGESSSHKEDKNCYNNRGQNSQRVSVHSDFIPTAPGKKGTRSALVGKADPVRDLAIFVAAVLFLFYISRMLQGSVVGKPSSPMNDKDGPSSWTQIRQALEQFVEAKMNDPGMEPRMVDCDLFLAKSAIPQTGLGVFAGRNYSVGEEIMILSPPTLPVEMNMDDADLSSSSPPLPWKMIWISPESLLFKHHPTMANIKASRPLWTESADEIFSSLDHRTIVITAEQEISSGHELFLTFDQHLHSAFPEWFDSIIPKLQDYQEADLLIQEARRTFRELPGPRGRNANNQERTGVLGQALRMVQTVVARYRPAVAKLLPVTIETLAISYRGRADEMTTSLYLGLRNKTTTALRKHGLCISDINVTTSISTDFTVSATSSASRSAVVTRNVTKGQRIHPVPMFVRLKKSTFYDATILSQNYECRSLEDVTEEESCQKRQQHPAELIHHMSSCWTRPEALVEFCPMLPLPPTMMMNIIDEKNEGSQATADSVALRWSTWMDADMNVIDLDLDVLQDKDRQLLDSIFVWDVVAVRDLVAGDQLVMRMDRDENTGQWLVPPDLLPRKWAVGQ